MKVAIVGAGISGLSSAHYLRKLCRDGNVPLELVLFESSARPGGVLDTVKTGDMVLELGPDSFITSKPWALDLARELGLEDSLLGVGYGKGKTTFVYQAGRLWALPEGFFLMAPSKLLPFLRSGLFSAGAKLRVLLEPLVPRGGGGDESVRSFVERRFGREIFDKVAQPLLGGIYMADPEKLSLSATMPQFLEMEKRSGSVFRDLLRNPPTSRGESGARYGLFLTPAEGMSVIVERLCGSAEFARQDYKTPVLSLKKSEKGWLVGSERGEEEFDAVILSVGAGTAGRLLSDIDPQLGTRLSGVRYVSSVVATLVFDETDFRGLPDGLGVIIPSKEEMNLVACSLYSSKFPGKSGSGKVVIRCFLGGELNPDAMLWDEEEIKSVLREELARVFGFDNNPAEVYIRRYPMSMPRFALGHKEEVSGIMHRLSRHSGLALCGAAYFGVGIPDCVYSAELAARKIHVDMVR
ncbi:MAG: protoporphyrinogen oxidase [Candidatus Dadabacteria bacterium]|nr:protoporphyrinogen oxidase [Candidatus Dadabacteria bacterium]